MKNKILCLIFSVLLSGMVGTASATPIVAIDLDSTTPGIQSSLTVAPGTLLMIDVVAYDDGSLVPGPTPVVVTAAIMDVTSSAPGVAALGVGGVATAGSFAGMLTPSVVPPSPFDATTGLAIMPGTVLTPLLALGPGTLGTVGFIDLFLAGAMLPIDPTGMTFVDLINLTALTGAAGTSTLSISSFPIFGFGGVPLVSAPLGGTITVSGPTTVPTVPEPGVLLLLSAGLLGFVGMRARHSPVQRVNSLG